MGELNQFNYYQIQSLTTADEIIVKMVLKKNRLATIYNFLRNEARWCNIGDYPLIAYIFHTAKKNGRIFSNLQLVNVFRKAEDKEFSSMHRDNELIVQLYD